jgi:hypothetical protein
MLAVSGWGVLALLHCYVNALAQAADQTADFSCRIRIALPQT